MKNLNDIYFPRTIPALFLRGHKFTWNDVDGGMIKIADLNIKQNSFMGGNVIILGWMKDYGLYACPNMYTNEIMALYVHDPSLVTKLGRKLVESAFPDNKVIFDIYKEEEFTAEDKKKLIADKNYALEQGLPPELVNNVSSEELKSLIEAHKSGKSEKSLGTLVEHKIEPTLDHDAEHEHEGKIMTKQILANKVQPKKAGRPSAK